MCLFLFTLNPTYPVLTDCTDTACSPVLIKNLLRKKEELLVSSGSQLSHLPLTQIRKITGYFPHFLQAQKDRNSYLMRPGFLGQLFEMEVKQRRLWMQQHRLVLPPVSMGMAE